jgi:hypothetical protein
VESPEAVNQFNEPTQISKNQNNKNLRLYAPLRPLHFYHIRTGS